MTTQKLTLLDAAVEKMHWHEKRQKELAANIANADTPGYKAKDIAPMDFKALLAKSSSTHAISVATTNPKHMGIGGATGFSAEHPAKIDKTSTSLSTTGNSVSLEEQLLKMNQNYTDHRLTTTIYQKNMDLLRAAIKN